MFKGNTQEDWNSTAVVFATLWCIRKARNAIVFNSSKVPIRALLLNRFLVWSDHGGISLEMKDNYRYCISLIRGKLSRTKSWGRDFEVENNQQLYYMLIL